MSADRCFWTDDETQRVKELYAGGATLAEISEAVNRSRSSIAGRINRAIGWDLIKKDRPKKPPKKPTTKGKRSKPIKTDAVKAYARSERVKRLNRFESRRRAMMQNVIVERFENEPESKSLTIEAIEIGQCRYATNNAAVGQDHLFCGHPVKPDSAYCEFHHNIVWTARK